MSKIILQLFETMIIFFLKEKKKVQRSLQLYLQIHHAAKVIIKYSSTLSLNGTISQLNQPHDVMHHLAKAIYIYIFPIVDKNL